MLPGAILDAQARPDECGVGLAEVDESLVSTEAHPVVACRRRRS
jgi:hypothetical protein